jgi:thiol-disulfide isomerase/thioredoxin
MIMKKLYFLLAFPFFVAFHTPQYNLTSEDSITLSCSFENCSSIDSISIYKMEGLFQSKVMSSTGDTKGNFTFTLPASKKPQYFYITVNDDLKNLKPIILGTEKVVKLAGPCYNMTLATVAESKINRTYEDAIKRTNELKIAMGNAIQKYQANINNQPFLKEAIGDMLTVDNQKRNLIDSLNKVNPFIAKIIALDTYTSFQNAKDANQYKGEVDYIGKKFFQYANFKEEDYDNIPYIFEMFRGYANIIAMPQLGLSKADMKTYFNDQLSQFKPQSMAYKYAVSGILTVLHEKQNTIFIEYGEKYIKDFQNDKPENIGTLANLMNQMKAQMLDVPAPEIAQADTTGNIRKLSNMKGKVVLIDFWASWCGPCRRENPNVVKLFNKYKTKGFDVFSVSLDQSRDRWIKAINDDGLVWENHVSDLKQWQNDAARTYNVTSIPRTILVDKEGKIIARDLRGEGLESKLKELFGE